MRRGKWKATRMIDGGLDDANVDLEIWYVLRPLGWRGATRRGDGWFEVTNLNASIIESQNLVMSQAGQGIWSRGVGGFRGEEPSPVGC